jgi:hypothetical protein
MRSIYIGGGPKFVVHIGCGLIQMAKNFEDQREVLPK